MKTILPAKISTIEEAQKLLSDLHKNGESYHPEDAAADIINAKGKELFTKEEADKLDSLMGDIYNLEGNDGRHIDLAFDPCKYLLQLDEMFQYIDKSGRGFAAKISCVDLLGAADEFNWDGTPLNEWAEMAEEGDEWENASCKYIRL